MPVFFPKDFVGTNIGITVDNFTINNDNLFQFAKRVTILRKNIRNKAEWIAYEVGESMQLPNEQL